jgi:hypothetical protein
MAPSYGMGAVTELHESGVGSGLIYTYLGTGRGWRFFWYARHDGPYKGVEPPQQQGVNYNGLLRRRTDRQ